MTPNEKREQTMIRKHGSKQLWLDYMRQIAAEGGRASRNGGFASKKTGKDGLTGPERARLINKRHENKKQPR